MTAICKGARPVLMLAICFAAGLCAAEEPKQLSPEDFAKMMETAGKPGPAHELLKPLAGRWTYTCQMWMAPGEMPIETKGAIEREWILGGRFLSEKIVGTSFDGKPGGFEGFGLIGYDNNSKKYTQTFVCSMGTGTSTGTGVADESGRIVFQTECACPLTEDKVKGRDEIRIVSPDKVITETYQRIDGKEVKVMEIVAVRKR